MVCYSLNFHAFLHIHFFNQIIHVAIQAYQLSSSMPNASNIICRVLVRFKPPPVHNGCYFSLVHFWQCDFFATVFLDKPVFTKLAVHARGRISETNGQKIFSSVVATCIGCAFISGQWFLVS